MIRRCSVFLLLATLVLTQVPLRAASPESALFENGRKSFQEQQYGLALEFFEEFAASYPLSDHMPDVQYYRAVSLFQLGRYAESLQELAAVKRKYRTTVFLPQVDFWEGMSYYARSEYHKASEALQRFLSGTEPGEMTPQALLYLSRALINQMRAGEAEPELRRLLREYRGFSEYPQGAALYAFVLLEGGAAAETVAFIEGEEWADWSPALQETMNLYYAEALWRLDRRDEAEDIYWSLLDSPQEISMVAQQRLFLLAMGSDNVAVMRDMMSRAEREFPIQLLSEFWFGIGVGSYRTGNTAIAEEFLQKVWDLRATERVDALVPILLARIRWDRGEKRGAVAVLSDYLDIEENPGIVLKRLGDYQRLNREYDKALSSYSEYLDRYPDSGYYGETAYHMAFTYYLKDDPVRALEWVNRAASDEAETAYTRDILSLRIQLLKELDRLPEALLSLSDYLDAYPEDIDKRIDMLRITFQLRDFDSLRDAAQDMKTFFPDLQHKDPQAHLLLLYLEGLSHIHHQSFRQALQNFQQINSTGDLGALRVIEAYSRYYEGWALYKLGNLDQAGPLFSAFADRYPGHELYTQALYLAGWSYYSSGKYRESLAIFTRLAEFEKGEYAVKATFLAGKSYANMNENDAARQIFRSLYKSYPDSALADDALYEFASIEAEEGRVESAASSYLSLNDLYPASPLRGEALFQRGQLYLNNGMSEQARDAFYEYRLNFPAGRLVDASLYWSGIASLNLDERFGAVLYWEIIIRDMPESPFRPEALQKTAEVYRDSARYAEARDLLLELMDSYPEKAEQMETAKHLKEIDFLIEGLSEREAELSVVIELEGVRTQKGRKAVLEYARMQLEKPDPPVEDIESLLQRVLGVNDPSTAMEAQFLLGETAFIQGLYAPAANAFLKAALIDPSNRDLAAFSLFRAAEMLGWEGRKKEVSDLVERLEKNFPSSQWIEEGKKLLEGMQ